MAKLNFSEIIVYTEDLAPFAIDPNSEYASVVARKMVFSNRCIGPLGYSSPELYREIYGFPCTFKPFYDSWRNIFVNRLGSKNEREEMRKQLDKDPDYLEKIAAKCEEDAEKLRVFSEEIKQRDFSAVSDEEIRGVLQKFFELFTRIAAYLMFPLAIQGYLEEGVREEIKKRVDDEKQADEYFSLLAVPAKQNTGYYEQLRILELASEYAEIKAFTPELEEKIDGYLISFSALGVKYGYGLSWTKPETKERIEFLADEDAADKLQKLKELPGLAEKQVADVLENLKANEEFRRKVRHARLYIYIRTLRTDVFSSAFANMFPLFAEVGRRNNLSLAEVVECTPAEIITFDFPKAEFIKERASSSVVRGVEGRLYYCVKNAKAVSQSFMGDASLPAEESIQEKVTEMKGTIANKGKVRGTVKIVLDNSELKKILPGDILVAAMTTPDFVPAMEKAAAFVTDEGGMLCHAAIVSREMKKPCIIGTKIATKVLKDGDLVEVDAEQGVVRIINSTK